MTTDGWRLCGYTSTAYNARCEFLLRNAGFLEMFSVNGLWWMCTLNKSGKIYRTFELFDSEIKLILPNSVVSTSNK